MKKSIFRGFFAVIVGVAILLGVLAMLTPIVRADTEPNNDFDQAELITPGTYTGSLHDTNDPHDYYKILISAGQSLSANVTPAASLAIELRFYNPAKVQVAYEYGYEGVIVKLSWTTNSAQPSYTYYIQVTAWTGSGAYSLGVSLTSQNDANSGGDAGDSLDTPTQIASANATYSGFLKDLDEDDYYKLNIMAGQTLSVTVTPVTTLAIELRFYNPAKVQVAYEYGYEGVIVKLSWTTNSAQPSYTYYIRVRGWSGYGTYSLELSIIPQNDAGSGGDAGDNLDVATLVNVGTYFGFIKDDDSNDCYRTIQNVTAGQGLYVRVTPTSSLAIDIRLYDETRVEKVYEWDYDGVIVTAGARATTTGIFYIKIHSWSGYGNYTMMISIEPSVGVPTHNPQTPIGGQAVKVSVSVTAVLKGVGNVVLSYSTNAGVSWTEVAMSRNATTGLYEGTIPGFPVGTNVHYKITAYNTVGDFYVQDNAGQYYVYMVIPEFSPSLLLPVFMILSLIAAILAKKRLVKRP